MAIDGFIPTLWSSQLLHGLKKSLVFGQSQVVNTDYEGEISGPGDTVKINAIGPIQVKTYTKNGTIAAPDTLTESQSFLTIDQADYFNFMVDDIDQVQTTPAVMGEAMFEASYALANKVDKAIEAQMRAGATTVGAGTLTITNSTDAYDFMIDAKVKLDEQNVPPTGRFLIAPAWYEGELLKDDRFIRATVQSVANSVVLNGQVRHVAGMDILLSNNTFFTGTGTIGDPYTVIAGHRMATSFADQISEVFAYRPESRFADAVKGLHVYGSKVIRPEALVKYVVTRV